MRTYLRLILSTLVVTGVSAVAIGCSDDSTGTPGDAADEQPTVEAGGTDASKDAPSETSTILQHGQIDRVGRPAVKLATIPVTDRAAYNAFDTFTDLSATPYPFDFDMQAGLVNADMWDGKNDWNGGALPVDAGAGGAPDGGYLVHPLGAVLKVDVLLLDTSKPFTQSGYFDLEKEELGLGAHTTSGGRWLNEDATDTSLSWIVGKSATGVSDGVGAPAKPASQTFPYLAAPN